MSNMSCKHPDGLLKNMQIVTYNFPSHSYPIKHGKKCEADTKNIGA